MGLLSETTIAGEDRPCWVGESGLQSLSPACKLKLEEGQELGRILTNCSAQPESDCNLLRYYRDRAKLAKMVVKGKSTLNAKTLHNHTARAIGKAPCFVVVPPE